MPKTTNPLQRRKSSSPFSTLQRKKPVSRKSSLAEKDDATDRLDDTGLTPSLAPPGIPQDVVSLIRHIQGTTWSPIPDRGAGMGSERISEVLRFRRSLPPIVSLAHLYAVSSSTTRTERELARLVAQGVVRKLTIHGRGKGGAMVGEGVVLVEEWKARVREESGLEGEVREKYGALMDAYPASPTVPTYLFMREEVRLLVSLGYLTTPTALTSNPASGFAAPPLLRNLSTAGQTAPTGTLAAVGGHNALLSSGGGSSRSLTTHHATRPSSSQDQTSIPMTFSLPATGAHLALLTSSRQHLRHLLKQLSPRHQEATLDLLREKWDGTTLARGEWRGGGVLPGKTRKWREFWGLTFDAILAECVGSGVVELFDTGSVGTGARGR